MTNIIDSSYNEQRKKDSHEDLRQIHNKTDGAEGDYHYCDVMIGGSQSMIGNLISDLHILHDNIYQGSIVVDKLGIKQIDSNLDRISAMESSW